MFSSRKRLAGISDPFPLRPHPTPFVALPGGHPRFLLRHKPPSYCFPLSDSGAYLEQMRELALVHVEAVDVRVLRDGMNPAAYTRGEAERRKGVELGLR